MEDKGTKKKVTRVKTDESMKDSIKGNEPTEPTKKFVATKEAKSEALKWRLIAVFAWIIAIAAEVFAIIKLKEVPVNMVWLIGLIIVALIGAVIGNILWKKANRLDPASVEQYTQQIQEVEDLSGQNAVYWTKFGTRFHLYSDCQHINTDKTDEILEGTVQQARELKNITELCDTCRKRKVKENESKKEEAHYVNPSSNFIKIISLEAVAEGSSQ